MTWLAIVTALAAWKVWRVGLRRGTDVTPYPVLFVLGYGALVTVHAAAALRGSADVALDAAWWGAPAVGVTALVWCALRLTDAVRIRRQGLSASPGA